MDYQETIIGLMRAAKEKIRARCAQNARAAWDIITDPEDILADPAYAHAATREEKRRLFREVQKEYDIRGFVAQHKPGQPPANAPTACSRNWASPPERRTCRRSYRAATASTS